MAIARYSAPPRRVYFNGGSTGGWEGLTAATRWPEAYDAVLACAADCRGRLPRRWHLDTGALETLGPHLDWRALRARCRGAAGPWAPPRP